MQPSFPPFQERLIRRLSALVELSYSDVAQLKECGRPSIVLGAGKELGSAAHGPQARFLVLDGWLARTKCLRDGRRQIVGFYVPGDVVSVSAPANAPITTSIAAIYQATLCPAPSSAGLIEAYTAAADLDQAYLYRQVVRLGRMSAFERVEDWMLEMRDRLLLAGMGEANVFALPITQEMLGDALGLTAVHINRTLKSLREARVLNWRFGNVRLLEDVSPARRQSGHQSSRSVAANANVALSAPPMPV